jgi:hypothetical protein
MGGAGADCCAVASDAPEMKPAASAANFKNSEPCLACIGNVILSPEGDSTLIREQLRRPKKSVP